jgi:hypothetical protein
MASKTGSAGTGIEYESAWLKFVMIPMSQMLDFSTFGLVLAEAVLFPAVLARLGGARMVHPGVVWPVVVMLLIYLPMPDRLLSSENADWRLLVPLAFILVGAAEDPFREKRGLIAIALLAVSINAAAAYNAWTFWRGGDRIVSELKDVLAALPRGARLFPYIPGDDEFRNAYRPPSVLHVATYAVIERAAMVPTLFAHPGQQPVEIRRAYAAAHDWYRWLNAGGPPPGEIAQLADPRNHVLEIRTAYTTAEPVRRSRLPAEDLAHVGHFTLYRLRSSGRVSE